MSNRVILYQTPSRFELEINGTICKDDFTSAVFEDVVGEVNSFLVSQEGQDFLDGRFASGSSGIDWEVPDPTPADFDGSNNYRIIFIKKV